MLKISRRKIFGLALSLPILGSLLGVVYYALGPIFRLLRPTVKPIVQFEENPGGLPQV